MLSMPGNTYVCRSTVRSHFGWTCSWSDTIMVDSMSKYKSASTGSAIILNCTGTLLGQQNMFRQPFE